jgi:DNA processing protein
MSENYYEKLCYYTLNSIFGYEPKIATALISSLGSARAVFDLSPQEQEQILGPYSKFKGKICKAALEEGDKELCRLKEKGIRFIGRNEKNFPELLKECEDCPSGLYIRSASDIIFDSNKVYISIVGTRDLSHYGREWCERIVESLSLCKEKPVIISGLAIGADICAHLTALNCGLETIAILPCGIEDVYPNRHRPHASQIASSPGSGLATDYPPGTAPMAVTFLRRNRIIAGLSSATILIESKIKGGGMMTANLAFSYGREVFVLPGRADDLRSQGCNYLAKNKIAEPILDENSLIESLGLNGSCSRKVFNPRKIALTYSKTVDQKTIEQIYDCLVYIRGHRDCTIEEISRALGITYRDTAIICGLLENDSFIGIDLMQRCSIIHSKSLHL